MDKNKSISPEEVTCMTFGASWLSREIFFLVDVWARHSAFCRFSWGSNECIHDSSTVKMQSRNAWPSFLKRSRWAVARKTRMTLVIVEHVWNPLCTNLSFPQAVSEDTVNTFWKGSDFCSNCRAWDTARTFKGRYHLFHAAFTVADVGAELRVHRLCLSGHSYWYSPSGEEFQMKGHVYLNFPSNPKWKNQLEDLGTCDVVTLLGEEPACHQLVTKWAKILRL